jgi:L-cystine transport system substrate-binding protein
MKHVALITVLILVLTSVDACTNLTGQQGNTAPAAAAEEEMVITVGTMGTYFPYSYFDEETGELTGYDVEAVRLLDERMEDVRVEFQTGPFTSLFLDMDAGRINMVANQVAKNEEREAKYLFSEDGYIFVQSQLVVQGSDNTHTSLADFTAEDTLGAITGDYYADKMETYKEENDSPYGIQYYDGEYVDIFMDMDAGRVAGTLNDTTVVAGYAENMGLDIKCVGDVMESSFSFFIFRNDEANQEVKAKIDAALKEVRDDGSLGKLCEEWFGANYVNVEG